MDDYDYIVNSFLDRHILLNSDWLTVCLNYLKQGNSLQGEELNKLVYEQWKYSDLKDSCYSQLEQQVDTISKCIIQHPVVVQIHSIVDIGSSFNSQYRELTHEFIDNTGFNIVPEEDKADPWESKPRRMLRMEISDGGTIFKAIEYQKLQNMSLLTPPGCKLLLIPPIICRRSVLFLKGSNLQVLGGDLESFMAIGRPVQIMAAALGIPCEKSKKPVASTAVDNSRPNCFADTTLLNEDDFEPTLEPDRSRIIDEENVELATAVNELSVDSVDMVDIQTSETNDGQRPIFDPRRVPSNRMSSPRIFSPPSSLPPPRCPQSNGIHGMDDAANPGCAPSAIEEELNINETFELEESPPDFDQMIRTANMNRKRSVLGMPSDDSYTMMSESKRRPPPVQYGKPSTSKDTVETATEETEIRPKAVLLTSRTKHAQKQQNIVDMLGGSRPSRHRAASQINAVKVKQETIEIIELDDSDEDVKPDKSILEKSITQNPDDLMVKKYERLELVSLAQAQNKMRYSVGATTFKVAAICQSIVLPLRVVDDLWTQTVLLVDVSSDGIECIIDNGTLTRLIGWDCHKAMTVRNSTDVDMRKQGSNRLAGVADQMARLDLIWQIEWFGGGYSTPIVRDMQTLSQVLNG